MAEDEKLAGDVTENMLRAVRADRVAKAMARITGKPCNCNQRKMRLNALHRKLREAKARREQKNKDNTG
jgi:hypothetical protein